MIRQFGKLFRNFSKFTLRDQKSIDTSTLFYDIFLDPNSNRLIGLGPNLFNLKKDLFPMTISYSGRPLNHEIDQIKGIVFLRTELLDDRPLSPFEIKLSFRAFEQVMVIDPSICKEVPSKTANARLTLTTLQKNNPLTWISDWLLWHHRKFGIQRPILYDNSSSNREKLIDLLSSIAQYLKQTTWELTKRLLRYSISKPRIDMIYACEQEAFYFHFKGLNTGWRGGKMKSVPFNSAVHAIEPRLVQLEKSIDPTSPREA